MRRFTLMVALALMWGVATAGLAQDTQADQPAADESVTAAAPTAAELQAKIHRTVAALIEARSAEKPDPEKIEKLTQQLQEIRRQAYGRTPAAGVPPFGAWQCPWGGPGMGFGRGRGMGPGMGAGRGPAAGPGNRAWMGRGGRGGRGPAMGPGNRGRMGRGGGYGMGAGRGAGYGYGRGLGRQWGFIDRNGDGICDNLGTRWGRP